MGIFDYRGRTWRWESQYKGMPGAYKLYCANWKCKNFSKGTPVTDTVDGIRCACCRSKVYAKCKHCLFNHITRSKMAEHRHFKRYGYDSYETY